MSEMRFNPITLDWVVMSPARELRPDDFHHGKEVHPERPHHRDNCPFCAGNETMTPGEIARVNAPDGSWLVRVVPNKYSVFNPVNDLQRQKQGTFRSMSAAGVHEVVVEHPRHDLDLGAMGPAHLALILRMYRERYRALRGNPMVESIVIFKNQGQRAGSSLEHAHSQIMAAPVLSSQVGMRLQEARRFHELEGGCLYCTVLREEQAAQERIIETGTAFVAFMPYAALSPYHTWIFPCKHQSAFDEISDADIEELAGMLSRVLRRLKSAAGAPDYNITIRSAPVGEVSSGCFHWYLSIVSRISQLAGFELGSGTYINSMRPELCAERLRGVAL
ncbi:galactose-1-phosphate uridylyltransferase [Prosthecobacter sp.]|uniref:galactose-1-phosphate uridylyltransferase n=1 Tax=Prosthecobacter sp. TaxID=1965333 RepID=UPI0037847221